MKDKHISKLENTEFEVYKTDDGLFGVTLNSRRVFKLKLCWEKEDEEIKNLLTIFSESNTSDEIH